MVRLITPAEMNVATANTTLRSFGLLLIPVLPEFIKSNQ
jgi:hypothetical protein